MIAVFPLVGNGQMQMAVMSLLLGQSWGTPFRQCRVYMWWNPKNF